MRFFQFFRNENFNIHVKIFHDDKPEGIHLLAELKLLRNRNVLVHVGAFESL